MKRHLAPILGLISVLLAVGAVRAADQPLVLLDLPESGVIAPAVKAAYTALQPEYDIWWVKVHQPAQRDRAPAALVLNTGAKLPKGQDVDIRDYVRQGGGLVYVAAMAQEQQDATNEFLRPLGVRLVKSGTRSVDFKVLPHAVTRDIGDLPKRSLRYALSTDALEPLVMLDDSPVAVAGMLGQGRVVVLSQVLLSVADAARAPNSPQARLLAQAVAWAAGRGPAPTEPGIGAGQASDGPAAAADLTQTALVDLGATPGWQAISRVVREQLQAVQLPTEDVAYQAGKRTLAELLVGRPALLVLGSHRIIDDAEMAGLSEYVSGGGSVLVLGYRGTEKDEARKLPALNKALGEFGISFTWGRPAGQGVVKRHPITDGLPQPARVGPGGAVWAYADWPLATVGDSVVASAHEFRQGRLVVMDASTLLPATGKQAANSAAWFQKLLLNAVKWLTGK